jgi:very-long-chain ceramide synthase
MCKYLGYTTLPDIVFGVFLVSWIATRHVAYCYVLYSVTYEGPYFIPFDWRPSEGYFYNLTAYKIFVGLLTALQCLMLGWLYQALLVVVKVLKGGNAEDIRSDDE